ncbi:MAG: UbiA family prenyltransferase, partial [Nitrospirae bacterium]|nr:UbiA family prenyltransferase [Nitrospirota bacterium]
MMGKPASIRTRVAVFLETIKFSHTVFALPFAFTGMVLAANGWPPASTVFWIAVAMVGARTGAMGMNRVLDAAYDAKNPRTSERAIPKGSLSGGFV